LHVVWLHAFDRIHFSAALLAIVGHTTAFVMSSLGEGWGALPTGNTYFRSYHSGRRHHQKPVEMQCFNLKSSERRIYGESALIITNRKALKRAARILLITLQPIQFDWQSCSGKRLVHSARY
jgi:hypothetical protein